MQSDKLGGRSLRPWPQLRSYTVSDGTGAQVPSPYGEGLDRLWLISIRLQCIEGAFVDRCGNALTAQNLILAAGDAKIGTIDYIVRTNASPAAMRR